MVDSNIFYLSFWVNFFLTLMANGFFLITGFFGVEIPGPSVTLPYDTARGGMWGNTISTPIIGATAVNLPDGKILIWSAYGRSKFSYPDLGDRGKTRTAILDPVAGTSTEELVVNTNHDMFCPGTAFLPILPGGPARVMITGGTSTTQTTIYNIDTNSWSSGSDMVLGRGYHSMTLLGGTN
jgi:galactose oxidase